MRWERFLSTSAPLRRAQAGSVIEVGTVPATEPYTCTVMPGVEVVSSSDDRRCALFRSISRPSAILGATAGSTRALHAVEVSPSIARLGSPNLLAG